MIRFINTALALTILGVSPVAAKVVAYKLTGVTTFNWVEDGAITTEFPVGTPWSATVEWETTSSPLSESGTQARYRLIDFTLTFTGVTGAWTTSSNANQGSFTQTYLSGGLEDEIQFTSGWGPSNHTNPTIENWAPYSINLILADPTGSAIPALTPAPASLDFSDFSPLVADSYLKLYLNNDGNRYILGSIQSISSLNEPEISVKLKGGGEMVDGASITSFGTAKLGKSGKVKSYVITNTGGAPLTKLAVSTTGKHKADFNVTKLSVKTLAPQESTTVKVTFNPKSLKARKAALKITSTDGDENPFTIDLSGTGKQP